MVGCATTALALTSSCHGPTLNLHVHRAARGPQPSRKEVGHHGLRGAAATRRGARRARDARHWWGPVPVLHGAARGGAPGARRRRFAHPHRLAQRALRAGTKDVVCGRFCACTASLF